MTYLSKTEKDFAIPQQLSLFTTPPNQLAIEKIYFDETRPLANFTNGSVLEFAISGQGSEYVDMKRSRLYVRAKIVKADGTALADKEQTGIINMPLQTMWSQVDVFMNNKLVSLNSSHYPWKAYIKTILSSGTDEQGSQLQSQLFYKDDDPMDSLTTNSGIVNRYEYTQLSREFEMEGPLLEDVFNIDKYLIQGVDLYIKLYRSSNPFVLMSAETTPNYKLEIVDAAFKTCKVKVDSGVVVNHVKQIEKEAAKYYVRQTEIKKNTLAKDSGEFIWDNMFPKRPSLVIIGLTSQKGGNGSYELNPLNFKHYSTTDVALYVNGESVPARPLKLDFGNNLKVATAYLNLFEACEKINKDTGLNISLDDFVNGYTLYAFPLDPTCLDQEYINLVRYGNVRLEMKFGTVLPETVTCIAYAEYPSLLEIDSGRRVRYAET